MMATAKTTKAAAPARTGAGANRSGTATGSAGGPRRTSPSGRPTGRRGQASAFTPEVPATKVVHGMEEFQKTVDETILQADLAGMNARDGLAGVVQSTENTWFAASNRLSQASKELFGGLRGMWQGADRAFTELSFLPTDVVRAMRRH